LTVNDLVDGHVLLDIECLDWHHARILVRWLDRYGREVVQLEWHAALETWTDEFLAGPGKIREV
jgi:hypothetical protein